MRKFFYRKNGSNKKREAMESNKKDSTLPMKAAKEDLKVVKYSREPASGTSVGSGKLGDYTIEVDELDFTKSKYVVKRQTFVQYDRKSGKADVKLCDSKCCFNRVFYSASTSIAVIMSFLYACVLIAGGIAIVVAQEITHLLPNYYYEGFFTYLYGVSILFEFIMLCFLLQEWHCCPKGDNKGEEVVKKTKEASKNTRKVKPSNGGNDVSTSSGSRLRSTSASTSGGTQERLLVEVSPDSDDLESGNFGSDSLKRKTTQNFHHHGSFFMRLGTIGFGLGAMIYMGLQFALVTESFFTGQECYEMLQVINPVLQMIFTFVQMYFIFLNARLNIHRYKLIARFGLMHIIATNICVWIRTGIYECVKELKVYQEIRALGADIHNTTTRTYHTVQKILDEYNDLVEKANFRKLRDLVTPEEFGNASNIETVTKNAEYPAGFFVRVVTEAASSTSSFFRGVTSEDAPLLPSSTPVASSSGFLHDELQHADNDGFTAATIATAEMATNVVTNITESVRAAANEVINVVFPNEPTPHPVFSLFSNSALTEGMATELFANTSDGYSNMTTVEEEPFAAALRVIKNYTGNDTCLQTNIMRNLVEDSSPFLYPFVIDFSLIGAAVIFIIWRHIGRLPRFVSEENIEKKLEAMLSQRAVALAQAQGGSRMDCVGASKGLFFGLLMLVGSIICLVLYFVLILHAQLKSMAVYLADVSHTSILTLSILAIFIGFIRAKSLKFYPTDVSDLNDLLLAFSAIGVFIYSLFCIIAGANNAIDYEKHFFVMVTGIVTVVQVVLQFLYISDMSKRHVYLREHDRTKPGRQIVTFLIICNFTLWMLYMFESRKVMANPVQLDFYGFIPWNILEHITLPLCMFHRFYSGIVLAEIWKNSYKPRLE